MSTISDNNFTLVVVMRSILFRIEAAFLYSVRFPAIASALARFVLQYDVGQLSLSTTCIDGNKIE